VESLYEEARNLWEQAEAALLVPSSVFFITLKPRVE